MGTPWDARTYDRSSEPQQAWASEVLARLADVAPDATVLDIGCGTGRVTEALLALVPRGRVLAVDASADMVRLARDRLGDRAEVWQQDVLDLDLGETIDAIVSTAALHWVTDHDRLWARLARALRPGGRLEVQCGGQGNIARVRDLIAMVAGDVAPELVGWSPWVFAGQRAGWRLTSVPLPLRARSSAPLPLRARSSALAAAGITAPVVRMALSPLSFAVVSCLRDPLAIEGGDQWPRQMSRRHRFISVCRTSASIPGCSSARRHSDDHGAVRVAGGCSPGGGAVVLPCEAADLVVKGIVMSTVAQRFKNRAEAGRLLAERLRAYAGRDDVVVLALPRGGMPVASEVARALDAPLDVFVVRKLGVPGHEEVALGAIATGGTRVLNTRVIESLDIPAEWLEAIDARGSRRGLARRRGGDGRRAPAHHPRRIRRRARPTAVGHPRGTRDGLRFRTGRCRKWLSS